MSYFNEQEVRKAIEQLKPDGQLYEVRIIGKGKPYTAYFKNADKLIEELNRLYLEDTNVYITLNSITNDCGSRCQFEKFLSVKETTSDNNITSFDWLFIDMDPIRTSGISSSKEEYEAAMNTARKVVAYMDSIGFHEPVKAVSGNGAHLLYKVDLENNSENEAIIKQCLKVLAFYFNTDMVKIDEVNFNPSRICKLYGTVAQKGRNSEERPHRLSHLIGDIKDVQINDISILQNLANQIPKEEPKKIYSKDRALKEFSVTDWMDEHGIGYYADGGWEGGSKYILDHCPFNASHSNKDAMILVQPSGAIAFKCLHNSCRDKSWKDMRLLFEPDAYDHTSDDDRIERGWKEHNRNKSNVQYIAEPEIDEPMFLNPLMINSQDIPDNEFIRTGYKDIDFKMKGLEKTCVSVVSGLRGASKSTWLSQIMLNAICDEQNVLCYSGELTSKRFMNWMYLQAAGRSKVQKSNRYENSYYTTADINNQIAEWIGDRFWLYNNRYGNNFKAIADKLLQIIQQKKIDLVVIDNIMALDLNELNSRDKYEAQTAFVWSLQDIAKKSNTHIIFVAHPRKAQGFLRLDDISGSGNIANAVDNAFIVHRNNNDFQRLTQQMFGWHESNPIYESTNIVEIAKNRESGIQDHFIPLWYEVETKRLKNCVDEIITYPWYDDGFIPVTDDDMEAIPF